MKTARAHNDQLTGSVEITESGRKILQDAINKRDAVEANDSLSRSGIRRIKHLVEMKNPNLRVIEWKPYPDCIPNSKNYYLVTVDYGKDDYGEYLETPECFWGDEGWGKEYGDKIIAFAELPEPYKEKP